MSEEQTKGLRMEAQAVKVGQLSLSQLKAAVEIAEKLHSAFHQKQPKRSRDQRRNQILMLSGDKGSGKTTLALSLRCWYDLRSHSPESDLGNPHVDKASGKERELYKQFGETLKKRIESCPNIIWLDALSLDTVPPGTNLVAAMFARITESAARQIDPNSSFRQDRGLLEPVSLFERALHELGSLRSDAVMALEGNLHRRADGMDPESYAIAAIENEKKKLEAADRLNSVLRRLIERATTRKEDEVKGMFVLPIDDIDSSPARAVEMLKLAYSLSIPRLVFLLLGSIDAIDQILFYQIQGEFRELLRAEGEADADALERVTARANEIASSSLRKMIPPSQRIVLEPLTLEHAVRFEPEQSREDSSRSRPLDEILKSIEFQPKVFCCASDASGKINLKCILLARDPFAAGPRSEQQNQPEARTQQVAMAPLNPTDYFYDGVNLLRSAPRQLTDLYGLLAQHSEKQKEKQTREEIHDDLIHRLFAESFRTLVDEDGPLTPPVQNALKECLQLDPFTGEVELTPPSVSMVTETGDWLGFELGPSLALPSLHPSCEVLGQRVRSLELESTLPGGKPRRFGVATRAAFKTIHDLIRLTGRGVVTDPIPHADRSVIARTRWDDGVNEPFDVPWFQCDWLTFWHTDLFFRLWDRGLQRIRQVGNERSPEIHDQELSYVMTVIAATALISTAGARTEEPDSWLDSEIIGEVERLFGGQVKRPKEGWSCESMGLEDTVAKVAASAKKLADHAEDRWKQGEVDEQTEQISRALVNLVLLLAPECGIDKENQLSINFGSFLDNDYVKKTLSPQVRKLRLKRLGVHALTRLGITLLNPSVALGSNPSDEGVTRIHDRIKTSHSLFAAEDPKYSCYQPSIEDLRQVASRAERTRAIRRLHASERDFVSSLLFPKNDSQGQGR